jgi:hypothetical protein
MVIARDQPILHGVSPSTKPTSIAHSFDNSLRLPGPSRHRNGETRIAATAEV